MTACIYSEKGSDGEEFTAEERKNSRHLPNVHWDLHGSYRKITAHKWYSSVQSVEDLKKRDLTLVGIL